MVSDAKLFLEGFVSPRIPEYQEVEVPVIFTARNEFVEARKLEAKIERITELVRISKLQARMSHEGMNNY